MSMTSVSVTNLGEQVKATSFLATLGVQNGNRSSGLDCAYVTSVAQSGIGVVWRNTQAQANNVSTASVRWELKTITAETANATGCDLSIECYDNAGANGITALTITRATGDVTFAGSSIVTGGSTFTGFADFAGGIGRTIVVGGAPDGANVTASQCVTGITFATVSSNSGNLTINATAVNIVDAVRTAWGKAATFTVPAGTQLGDIVLADVANAHTISLVAANGVTEVPNNSTVVGATNTVVCARYTVIVTNGSTGNEAVSVVRSA